MIGSGNSLIFKGTGGGDSCKKIQLRFLFDKTFPVSFPITYYAWLTATFSLDLLNEF